MAETAFRGSTATSGAIDTNKKTGLKKTPVTFADFDAKMRSYGGSLPPGFDPRKFDIGGEGAIPGDTSMFPRMGKRIRGTGFPDKSELYESRESGPSPRFDPTSSGSVEEAARAAERSYAESTGEHDYGVFTGEGAIPSFEPEPYDSTPEGMGYRRDSYTGAMEMMPDIREGDGRRWSRGELLPEASDDGMWTESGLPISERSDGSGGFSDLSLLDPEEYGASGVKTDTMKAPGSGGPSYGDSDPFAGMSGMGFDPGVYSPGLAGSDPTAIGRDRDIFSEEVDPWAGIGYSDFEDVPSELDTLKKSRRVMDPLWDIGSPSMGRPMSGTHKDAFSRYYVPGSEALRGPGTTWGFAGSEASKAESGVSDKMLDSRYGWGDLTTGKHGDLGTIPEGMTRGGIADSYMEGVTGIDRSGMKWHGDPEGYARGDPWVTPSMYDPETGTFAAPTSERMHKDYFPSGPTPGSGYTAEGDHYVRPLKPTPREGFLERGSFATGGVGTPGRYAFEPESGEFHYPSGTAEPGSDRLKDFYGEEAYGRLRAKDGKGWASEAELASRAEAEGWEKGGHLERGKFVPEGGYMDEDGVVWGPDGYIIPDVRTGLKG